MTDTLTAQQVRQMVALANGQVPTCNAPVGVTMDQEERPDGSVPVPGRDESRFRSCHGQDCGLCNQCLNEWVARRNRRKEELTEMAKAQEKRMTAAQARKAVAAESKNGALTTTAEPVEARTPAPKRPPVVQTFPGNEKLTLTRIAAKDYECQRCGGSIAKGTMFEGANPSALGKFSTLVGFDVGKGNGRFHVPCVKPGTDPTPAPTKPARVAKAKGSDVAVVLTPEMVEALAEPDERPLVVVPPTAQEDALAVATESA
jgi:hypothetical protein